MATKTPLFTKVRRPNTFSADALTPTDWTGVTAHEDADRRAGRTNNTLRGATVTAPSLQQPTSWPDPAAHAGSRACETAGPAGA